MSFNSDIPIDIGGITKILSGGRKSSGLSQKSLNQVENMIADARDLFDPKVVYDIFEKTDLPPLPYFKEAEQVALSVCTIGEQLPNKVVSLFKDGKLVEGTILDAIGSIAADALADKINEKIDNYASKNSLETTLRYSPGYCSWPLTGQSVIFAKLPVNTINVTLTKSYLMVPVKSVSFAVNIGPKVSESSWENRCRTCRKVCDYRR
ncbi:MAG: vitamin B12 dependent-methionine synthase activation domain-containing protein, partial [Candidatus Kariarchaeaceae archaeon]